MTAQSSDRQEPRSASVSVVVPAYNHADTLPVAIDSLLAQEYPGLEVIVLDDGSTDHTRTVLSGYGSSIRWETHANMGQAATLNKGWNMARGEILGYLSADDFLYKGAIHAAVAVLTASAATVVTYSDFDHVDPEGRKLRAIRRPEFSLERMLTTLDCPPGPGAFFRRSAYEASGGWNPDLRQIPDFDFWLRMARHGRFEHIPQVLAAWRIHPDSQSFAVAAPERAEESVRVISAFFAQPDIAPRLRQLLPRSMARAHLYCAQLHARAGRYREAARNIVRAHRLFPGTALQPHTWRSVINAFLNRPVHRLIWWLRKMTGTKA